MHETFEEPPNGLIPSFSKTKGNTYATIVASPFPLQGKPMQAQDVAGAIVARRLHNNGLSGLLPTVVHATSRACVGFP